MSNTKNSYSLNGAFKRWCELTGDYDSILPIDAPIWFKVEALYLFPYTITKVNGKTKRFSKNYRYSIQASDEDLMLIKTYYRDKFIADNQIPGVHEYQTTYDK